MEVAPSYVGHSPLDVFVGRTSRRRQKFTHVHEATFVDPETVRLLVDHSPDSTLADRHGATPLLHSLLPTAPRLSTSKQSRPGTDTVFGYPSVVLLLRIALSA